MRDKEKTKSPLQPEDLPMQLEGYGVLCDLPNRSKVESEWAFMGRGREKPGGFKVVKVLYLA